MASWKDAIREGDLTFYPVEGQPLPIDYGTMITDRWWIVHPGKGIAVWRNVSPQCSANQRVVESLASRLYPNSDVEVEFLPMAVVWIDHNA